MITVGGLYSGVGGIELGLRRAGGFSIQWMVERDEYCQRVLRRHWPSATVHGDIESFDPTDQDRVDLICGGFPCISISQAGDKLGLDGDESGPGWEQMLRVIRRIRPRYVLVENTSALAFRGLGVVLGQLSAAGYDAEWHAVECHTFGYPHRRSRIFIVAYPPRFGQPEPWDCLQNPDIEETPKRWQTNHVIDAIQRSTLPPLCESNHGFPERVVKDGRKTAGSAAVKALGNSVCPDIAEWLGKCIRVHMEVNDARSDTPRG